MNSTGRNLPLAVLVIAITAALAGSATASGTSLPVASAAVQGTLSPPLNAADGAAIESIVMLILGVSLIVIAVLGKRAFQR